MMEDELIAYRARHHQQYIAREDKRKQIEQSINETLEQFEICINGCMVATTLKEVKTVLHELHAKIELEKDNVLTNMNVFDIFKHNAFKLLQVINENVQLTAVITPDVSQMQDCNSVHTYIRQIMSFTGAIAESEDIELNLEMDCSRDEEIARQLQLELMSTVPPQAQPNQRRRARRRRRNQNIT